jgi:hypothetical protein
MAALRWERLQEVYGNEQTPNCSTYRAKVPGGWLVSVWCAEAIKANEHTSKHTWGGGLTFVPDVAHAWDVPLHPKP